MDETFKSYNEEAWLWN